MSNVGLVLVSDGPSMQRLFARILLVLICAPMDLTAAWRLDYDVAETRTAPLNAPPERAGKVEKRSYALRVWLEADSMVIERERITTWWNFTARTVTTFDHDKRLLDQTNLLATLGFREAEFQNRLRLDGAFKAAGVKSDAFDPVLMEHLFSLRAPQSPESVLTVEGESGCWMHSGKLLFAVRRNGPEWSDSQRRAWLRFVIYLYGLHPEIVTALTGHRTVPGEMELGRFNTDEEKLLFTLRAATDEASPAVPASGVGDRADSVADRIALHVEQMGATGYRAACAELRKDFEAAFDAKRVFEGALLMLEWGLWTDALTPELVNSHRDALSGDTDCQTLFASLNPRNKADAEKAVAALLAFENRVGKGQRALRIFRANILTKLGKFQEARQLFIDVLTEAPANVGALKDLGDIYYGAYEMSDAWRCWDAAKRLLPSHKNLKPVIEMERRLIAKNEQLL